MAKYIGTISAGEWTYGGIKAVLRRLDLHEFYIGREVGKNGFEHYQFAVSVAGDLEQYCSDNYCGWHVEVCKDWGKSVRYCIKSGQYYEYSDRDEFKEYIRIRNRPLRKIQQDIIESVRTQNDRAVTVWINRRGNVGKSTVLYIMSRRGEVFDIPGYGKSPDRILEYLTMNYDDQPIIAIDLPRHEYVTKELSVVLEKIKDGHITSVKYQGGEIFIRGVRLIVMTNNWVENEALYELSKDRWDIRVINDDNETWYHYEVHDKPEKSGTKGE